MADSDSFSEPMQVDAPLEFSDDDETDNRSDIEQPMFDEIDEPLNDEVSTNNSMLVKTGISKNKWNIEGTRDNERDLPTLRLYEVRT
jgi:hypothetical protein